MNMLKPDRKRRTSPAAPSRQIRLLGPQRLRRPGDQQDRAAHRLGHRLQPQAGADRRSAPASTMRSARSASPPATAPTYQHESVSLQPRAARRHRAAECDRRASCPGRGTRRWPPSRSPRSTTSPTAASPSTSSAAGSAASSPRSASPGSTMTSATAARRNSSARCAASGPRTTSPSAATSIASTDYSLKPKPLAAAARDLPGRQFARRARHGRAGVRLVLHQRQHARGHPQAGRRHPRQGGGRTATRVRIGVNAFAIARETEEEAQTSSPRSSRRPTPRRSTPSATR